MRYPAVILVLLAMGLGTLSRGGTMTEDELLVSILDSHAGLAEVVERAAEYRLQVVLGLVEEGPEGRAVLRQHTFRAAAEYFYPASTVKLFAAVAAAQRLVELRRAIGLAIDLDTPLVYHPQFEDGELEAGDGDNVESGKITVRGQIREIFLVSDNQAFNFLYELVGQDGLARSMRRAGLDSPRVVHRLSELRSAEENLQSPKIDFVGEGFTYSLPARTAEPLAPAEPVERILVGKGYYSGDELVEAPMDFSPKNYFPLVDLQRGLCMLVRPDVDCGGPGFELEEADRQVMLEAMSQYPRESKNPVYDPEEYPDTYVKDLLPGLERVVPREQLRIYNKTGQAYGFSTENAWVVNEETGQGFFSPLRSTPTPTASSTTTSTSTTKSPVPSSPTSARRWPAAFGSRGGACPLPSFPLLTAHCVTAPPPLLTSRISLPTSSLPQRSAKVRRLIIPIAQREIGRNARLIAL